MGGTKPLSEFAIGSGGGSNAVDIKPIIQAVLDDYNTKQTYTIPQDSSLINLIINNLGIKNFFSSSIINKQGYKEIPNVQSIRETIKNNTYTLKFGVQSNDFVLTLRVNSSGSYYCNYNSYLPINGGILEPDSRIAADTTGDLYLGDVDNMNYLSFASKV